MFEFAYFCPTQKNNKLLKMKKLVSLILVAGMALFYACGPSAEEKEAAEKARQDSIAYAEKAIQDSIAAAEQAAKDKAMQDSIMAAEMAAREKAMLDSIAAAAKKSGTKPKATTKPKEEPKVEDKKSKFNKSGAVK